MPTKNRLIVAMIAGVAFAAAAMHEAHAQVTLPQPTPPTEFVIDLQQRNIVITNLKFTFTSRPNGGSIQWNIEYDQYNATQALRSPSNGTLYIDF